MKNNTKAAIKHYLQYDKEIAASTSEAESTAAFNKLTAAIRELNSTGFVYIDQPAGFGNRHWNFPYNEDDRGGTGHGDISYSDADPGL